MTVGRTTADRASTISGPDIPIARGSVMSFALLLHEFATNAVKYGALSTSAGAVAIDCSEDDRRFARDLDASGADPPSSVKPMAKASAPN